MTSVRWFVSIVFFAVFSVASIGHAKSFHVYSITIDGPISPAQDEFLSDSIRYATEHDGDMLLLVLDTPGGLVESMRSMVATLLNSPIPVGVWVGPDGAHAASAGVFLVAASNVAGMAPQTNIGAATPVGLGGQDISSTTAKKIQQDLTSLVRGVATAHGRNVQWFEQSISEAATLTGPEAKAHHVVEYIASDPLDFLKQVGRGGLFFENTLVHFGEEQIVVDQYDPGVRYVFLSWLLHPEIAYLLLMGGILGLFIEMTHPGIILPGVVGSICLLLGLYAMSILPTNITGLLLIACAFVFYILEIKVTSFGLLALAATGSLFLGSIILFRDEYGSIAVPTEYIVTPVLFLSGVIVAILYLVLRPGNRHHALGEQGMVGLTGKVLSWDGENGQISVRGEIWAAKGVTSDFTPSRDLLVIILSINGLKLNVGPYTR